MRPGQSKERYERAYRSVCEAIFNYIQQTGREPERLAVTPGLYFALAYGSMARGDGGRATLHGIPVDKLQECGTERVLLGAGKEVVF